MIKDYIESGQKTEFAILAYVGLFLLSNFAGVSFFSNAGWAPYIQSNTGAAAGSAWVEGSTFRWADGSNEYRIATSESSLIDSSSSGPSGALWVEGTDLHWIDQNSNERSITGASTGDSPGSSGSAWIENGVVHYIDANGDERAIAVPWREHFEDGNANGWTGSNYYIKSDNARGTYSIGSSGQGSIDAEIVPTGWEGGIRPDTLSYQWWETSSQTGHTVDFIDSSGNYVIRSGSNNPQWEVSDGTGTNTIYTGSNYKDWTEFSFNFDWANCQYSYTWKNHDTGHTETGTRSLNSCSGIEKIRLSNDYWGSADYVRFDAFKASSP